MAKLNHSSTLSIGGAVSNTWGATVGAVVSGTDKIKKGIGSLKKDQRGITEALRESQKAAEKFGIDGSAAVTKLSLEHRKLKERQSSVAEELKKAQKSAKKLGKDGSTEISRLVLLSEELSDKERKIVKGLEEARRAAAKLGVEGSKDVARLRAEHERLDKTLERQNRRLSNAKAWEKLGVGGKVKEAVGGTLKNVGGLLESVARKAIYAGTAIGGVGIGLAGWFTKSALEATASVEKLETSLITLTGSNAKADAAMKWITRFATKTPYEMTDVAESFARLKAYGIEPTNGMLETLGDTASSMGKPLMSAVEAIADAVTGENERLKEFGIRATKSGNQITYFYKNAAGEDVKKKVKKNSQTMIADTLRAIWNEKYAGAMERQSHTWEGLMSNLKDHWTQFQVRVMRSGAINVFKGQLEGLLDRVSVWAEDGTLQRWADEINKAYSWAFAKIREGYTWLRDNWPEIKSNFLEFYDVTKKTAKEVYSLGKWLSDAVGGPENLAKGFLILGAAKVLSPLSGLVTVGFQIVGWLAKATGLSGFLASNLSKAGGAIGGAVKAGGAKAGGAIGLGASAAGGAISGAAGGLLGKLGAVGATSVGAASAGAIAGTVAAGAAIGVGTGYAINKGTEALTGASLSDHIASYLYGLTEAGKKRSEIIANSEREATRGAIVTQSDNRKFDFHVVGGANASADEIAEKVMTKINQAGRAEWLGAYQ